MLPATASAATFEVTRTDAEWRAMLTDLQYQVMRHEAIERPRFSPLDKNYADGTYFCRGCDLPLYASATKYDSKTGWPSFYDNLPDAIRTKQEKNCFPCAPNAIAVAVAATLVISLTTVLRLPECGIALMV